MAESVIAIFDQKPMSVCVLVRVSATSTVAVHKYYTVYVPLLSCRRNITLARARTLAHKRQHKYTRTPTQRHSDAIYITIWIARKHTKNKCFSFILYTDRYANPCSLALMSLCIDIYVSILLCSLLLVAYRYRLFLVSSPRSLLLLLMLRRHKTKWER